MSRNTLRTIIVLAAISIAGITVTQLYWVRKAFDLKENQFNRDVQSALQGVADRLFEMNHSPLPANSPVQQVSTNYFVVLIDGPVNASVLGFLIASEFEKRHITADYELGIYDCEEKCVKGANLMAYHPTGAVAAELPTWKNDGYYFGVQFSRIEANLINQMGIWVFSSVVMVLVICFFVYTLFVIFKQKRLSEIQKDFISNMTHEFKTPLATIALSSGVLKDPSIVESPARLLNYATIIQTESNRLKQQVERVLQMAKLQKSEVSLKLERLDMHDVIRETLGNRSLALKEKQATVSLQLEAIKSTVLADHLHLTNVLFNLIDNAASYNKRTPEILIVTGNVGNQIFVEVHDNGIGIRREDQKKIFHQFYRIPTGNLHDVKGFGLGLNYVKIIVEAHRGKISVRSRINEGSIFQIRLPNA